MSTALFGMEHIQKLEKSLANYPAIDNFLVNLEKKTQVKKIYLIYGTKTYYFAKNVAHFLLFIFH